MSRQQTIFDFLFNLASISKDVITDNENNTFMFTEDFCESLAKSLNEEIKEKHDKG